MVGVRLRIRVEIRVRVRVRCSVGWPPCSHPKGSAFYHGRRASRAAGLAPAPRDIPPSTPRDSAA